MALLIRPNMLLEAAFRNNEDGSRIWANLTDYVELGEEPLNIQQRRQNVFDDRSPGTLSFALNNQGAEFTDTNASSVFYPGVTQNSPLRVRIQYPASVNLLPGNVSRSDDVNGWEAQQGELDTNTAAPPAGVTSNLVWATGVLEQTGIRVKCDTGPWDTPGDMPIYVKAGKPYSARIAAKADGTISCSLRMAWYDRKGVFISEDTSSTVALSSSYQTLSATNKIAPADGTLRIAIANETTVLPAARAISFSGRQEDHDQWVTKVRLQMPDTATFGDTALVWIRLSDKSFTVSTPSGWTAVNNWSDARGRTYLFRKVVSSGDKNKTIAWTATGKSRMLGIITTYSGVDQVTPLHQNAEATETINRVTHTTPNVTTTIASCWILSAAFDVSTTNTTWGAAVGEIIRQTGFCLKGNACTGIVTDDGVAHATGTYGTKAFTAGTKSRFATMHTIALAPAAGTGPGNVNVSFGAPMVVQDSSLPSFVTAGDWHKLITAYADEWAPYWQNNRALIAVTSTDRMKLLESIQVGAAINATILDSDPIAFYKMDESGDLKTTSLGDSSPVSQPPMKPVKVGTGLGGGTDDPVRFAEGKGPGVDGSAALILNPSSSASGYMMTAEYLKRSLGGPRGITTVLWFASSQGGTAELTLYKSSPVTKSLTVRTYFEIYGKPGNYLGIKALVTTDGTTFNVSAQSSAEYFDKQTHMVAGTLEMTGGQAVLKLYIDGVLMTTSTVATPITNIKRMNCVTIGNAYPKYTRLCLGTYSNLAMYNSVLTEDDIADIWTAGDSAFSNELVADRLSRIMNWANLTDADLDDSPVFVDRHMPDEMSLPESMRLVTATDGGTLYINGDDKITFRQAAVKETESVPVLTLTAGDLSEQPSASQNDALLVNDCTVNRLGADNSQRITNAASIAKYGVHEKTVDTLTMTDQEAAAIAGYFIAFFAQPITRIDTISVEALLLTDWTNLLAVDMWKIIRITDLPPTAPATTIDSHVEGIEWSIDEDSWLVTFDVSYAIPFAIIDDAARKIMGNVVVAR
jgi:hypothetical protein